MSTSTCVVSCVLCHVADGKVCGCCSRRFSSLTDLRQHLVDASSFVATRERALETLQQALSGDAQCQKAVFEPPLRAQLRVVLQENDDWQVALHQRLADLDVNRNNSRSKRARS